MSACRLAERRHRRSPHRSQLPCPDLRLRPHCRTDRRDPNRHEEFSSCATCHRYRDAGGKMYMHFRHGSLRPQQARIQTADRRVDRSYLQIRGAGFTKKITQYRPYRIKFKSLAEYYFTVTSTGAWSDKKASPSVSASTPYFRTLSPLRTNT